MARLWVTGDALIDFVPTTTKSGAGFAPKTGGSTYNVAKAAARQNAQVSFIGQMSNDMFGDQLAQDLAANGVDIAQALRVDAPTTLAFVQYQGANARYAFYNLGSATATTCYDGTQFSMEPNDFLHTGSIALIDNPGAANIADFVLSQNAMMSFDPNVRAGMIANEKEWRARTDALMKASTVLKLSDEDLNYIAPQVTPEDFAQSCVKDGIALVVVTLGEKGAIAMTKNGFARAPALDENIIDTVGAGDTVTGTLLASLMASQTNTREKISSLNDQELATLLERAMVAAWLNCQQSGCNPPHIRDLDLHFETRGSS